MPRKYLKPSPLIFSLFSKDKYESLGKRAKYSSDASVIAVAAKAHIYEAFYLADTAHHLVA